MAWLKMSSLDGKFVSRLLTLLGMFFSNDGGGCSAGRRIICCWASHYDITGSIYNIFFDMYFHTKCSITFGKRELILHFTYGKGVRQGCVLYPLLFNLYLNEIPNLLKACNSNDPIILPNG